MQGPDDTSVVSKVSDATNPAPTPTYWRHGFRMSTSYRKADTRDEVLDRRRRKREGLFAKSAATSSRIYRARHTRQNIDLTADDQYLPKGEGGDDEEEEDRTGGQSGRAESAQAMQNRLTFPEADSTLHGTPARTHETSLNAMAAKKKEIEDALLAASEGRVSGDLLVIQPSDEMSKSTKKYWEETLKAIVKDMKEPSSPLGQLVGKLKRIHRKKAEGGEDELGKNLLNLAISLSGA